METPNDALRNGFSTIDTPGTDSLSGLDDYALTGLSRADAVLYVMPHPGDDDKEVLSSPRDTMAGTGLSAASVLGVLGEIDRLTGDTGDPWSEARDVAKRNAVRPAGDGHGHHPLRGLVAETVLGERFIEVDARLPRLLAAAEPDQRDFALSWPDVFTQWHAGPRRGAARGCSDCWACTGSGSRLASLTQGLRSTPALTAGLREASGVDTLLARMRRVFVDRADRLRTAAAIATLDRVAWRSDNAALRRLRAESSALGREPGIRAVWLAAGGTREARTRGDIRPGC